MAVWPIQSDADCTTQVHDLGPVSHGQEDYQHSKQRPEQRGPNPHLKNVHIEVIDQEPTEYSDGKVNPSQR